MSQDLTFLPPEVGIVVQDHIEQGIVDFEVAVVLDEPELAELAHEGAHARCLRLRDGKASKSRLRGECEFMGLSTRSDRFGCRMTLSEEFDPGPTVPRPGWLHEIKHNGFLILARRNGAGVQLITRAGNDFSSRFPFIAMAVGRLLVRSC